MNTAPTRPDESELPPFVVIIPVTRQLGPYERTDHLTVLLDDEHGATLIDTGLPGSEDLILHALAQRGVSPRDLRHIILTHGDMDHAGSARALVDATRATLWASSVEGPYIERTCAPYKNVPENFLAQLPPDVVALLRAGVPAVPVTHTLHDGHHLPFAHNAEVVSTPGHTPGHVSLFLRDDSVLISGDAVMAHEGELVFPLYTLDEVTARLSIGRLARLAPSIVIAQHGGVVHAGVTEALGRLVTAS